MIVLLVILKPNEEGCEQFYCYPNKESVDPTTLPQPPLSLDWWHASQPEPDNPGNQGLYWGNGKEMKTTIMGYIGAIYGYMGV